MSQTTKLLEERLQKNQSLALAAFNDLDYHLGYEMLDKQKQELEEFKPFISEFKYNNYKGLYEIMEEVYRK